jgi:hypothetical protein
LTSMMPPNSTAITGAIASTSISTISFFMCTILIKRRNQKKYIENQTLTTKDLLLQSVRWLHLLSHVYTTNTLEKFIMHYLSQNNLSI